MALATFGNQCLVIIDPNQAARRADSAFGAQLSQRICDGSPPNRQQLSEKLMSKAQIRLIGALAHHQQPPGETLGDTVPTVACH